MELLARAPRGQGNHHPQIHRPLIGTGHLGRWGPCGHHPGIHRLLSSTGHRDRKYAGSHYLRNHRPLIGTDHLGRWDPSGHHPGIHRLLSSKRRRVNLFRYQGMNNLRPGRLSLCLGLMRLNPKADGPEGLGQAGSR